MSKNIESLKAIFAAINRNEVSAIVPYCDPGIERIEPSGYETAGSYHGHREVVAQISKGRSTWAEGSCDPERFITAGDKVVVYLHARVRLKDKIDWIDGRFADGFVFRDGKVILMQTFWDRSEALAWAGVKDET